ncbi:hypothetical protein BDW71DRAFT_210516 [Aspergillus fruticulosus]
MSELLEVIEFDEQAGLWGKEGQKKINRAYDKVCGYALSNARIVAMTLYNSCREEFRAAFLKYVLCDKAVQCGEDELMIALMMSTILGMILVGSSPTAASRDHSHECHGQERPVVIYLMTKPSSDAKSVGFVGDGACLNVALRAKEVLMIFSNFTRNGTRRLSMTWLSGKLRNGNTSDATMFKDPRTRAHCQMACSFCIGVHIHTCDHLHRSPQKHSCESPAAASPSPDSCVQEGCLSSNVGDRSPICAQYECECQQAADLGRQG